MRCAIADIVVLPNLPQDQEALCREAGKQAADWAASMRSMSELADETGYELASGHNRSLVGIIAEKQDRKRYIFTLDMPIWSYYTRALCGLRNDALLPAPYW